MTQRNPLNPRSQARQQGEHVGSSRKSAASAKPKSKAGASVYSPTDETRKKRNAQAAKTAASSESNKMRKRERALSATLESTPEYRWWRRLWWILIVVAIVAIVVSCGSSWLQSQGYLGEDVVNILSPVTLFVGYAGIILALIIDLGKIRRLRKDLEAEAHTLSKSERRKLDAQIEAQEAEREAAKAAKKAAKEAKKAARRGKSQEEEEGTK